MSSTTDDDGWNHTISPSFNSDDADLSFMSSDRVLFKIHSKNLDVNTLGFPPSDFKQDGELVNLAEDSETLNILFSFIYAQYHPDLELTPFELLEKVSEAAEKYQVFAAMNVCKIRMKGKIGMQGETLKIMIYRFKHGYSDIVRLAAPLLHDIPLSEMVDKLPTSMLGPWVKYHEQWRAAIEKSFLDLEVPHSSTNTVKQCPECVSDLAVALFRLRKTGGNKWTSHSVLLLGLTLFQKFRHLNADNLSWSITNQTNKVPTFDTFL